MNIKAVFGIPMFVCGIALMGWLAGYIMLYGGILQAVNNWGIDNPAVVQGILKAIFCEFGLIPGAIVTWFSAYWMI